MPPWHHNMENVIESAGLHATRKTSTIANGGSMHDVHTEFVDVGIGCTWFARRGEGESVTGATKEEAIARLADYAGLDSLFTSRTERLGSVRRT